jgi:thioredoxin
MITINYFSASWCGPCKMFAPIVEIVSQEEGVPVVKIDVEQNQEMAKAYDVRSVPTLVLMKNGTQVAKHTGIMGKAQLQQFINAHK